MSDPEFWKQLYQGKWKDGSRRAEKIGSIIESSGYEVREFGFLAKSDVYSKQSPDEKGIPDLEVNKDSKRLCLLEVTGTERRKGDDIWVRPDKFEYADNHPEDDCWLGYIEEDSDFIRFIKLEKATRFEIIYPIIRGVKERFKSISVKSPALIEKEEFEKYLNFRVCGKWGEFW